VIPLSLRQIADITGGVVRGDDAIVVDEPATLDSRAVEPGGLFVADNVLSHSDPLAQYSAARKADPTLESVTVPLDRGLEVSVVLR